MMHWIRDRVRKIFSTVSENLDCILIMKREKPNPSFSYVTGLTSGLFEGSIAILKRDGYIALVTSGLDKVKKEYIDVFIERNQMDLRKRVIELTKDCSIIGFDGMNTSFRDYKMLKKWIGKKRFLDVGEAILLSRLKKDDYEIEMIRGACKISDKVFDRLIEEIREGMKEREISLLIERMIKEEGGDDISFESIVAFGKNSAIPHHVPGNKRLKRNEVVLLDFGARYKGYVSDITRSFVYGKADKKLREIFDVVLSAQKMGMDSVKEGVAFEEIHKRVFNFIEKTRFKGKFIHSSGHTIGLEVHDGYRLGEGCKEKFSDGVTFTLEPGVYLRTVGGIRIEDDFVFKDGKLLRLTSAPVFLEL